VEGERTNTPGIVEVKGLNVMARLPYPEESSATIQRLNEFPVRLNLFRMLAHSEPVFTHVLKLGNVLATDLTLAPQFRELAILQVAHLSGSTYEWIQHTSVALVVGVTQAQIDAIEQENDAAFQAVFTEKEHLALQLARNVYASGEVSDSFFAPIKKVFTATEIVELLSVIGYYIMLARFLMVLQIDSDPPAGEALLLGSGDSE
jgi:alkylhydroperoxidase family enzyme